jgi:hypothetical protein
LVVFQPSAPKFVAMEKDSNMNVMTATSIMGMDVTLSASSRMNGHAVPVQPTQSRLAFEAPRIGPICL